MRIILYWVIFYGDLTLYIILKFLGSAENGEGCNAKEGNPFGPFWDTYNIDFVGSEFYGPLNYDIHYHDMGKKWKEKYPPLKWPVLSFTGKLKSFN